jgi:hypothetical protein
MESPLDKLWDEVDWSNNILSKFGGRSFEFITQPNLSPNLT